MRRVQYVLYILLHTASGNGENITCVECLEGVLSADKVRGLYFKRATGSDTSIAYTLT